MNSISKDIYANTATLKAAFSDEHALTVRYVSCAGETRLYAVCFLDGMVNSMIVNDSVVEKIIAMKRKEDDSLSDGLLKSGVSSASAKTETDFGKLCDGICEGNTAVFADGESTALIIDAKGYAVKAVSEPSGEQIVKGPHEGFTEEILTNMSMLRRRIASSDLKMETMILGEKTHTKVCVCYVEKIAKKKIVSEVIRRLEKIDCDEILESNYITEYIRDHPLSPFKTVGSTERPDIVAAKLLEGRVAIIVNGTPAVLTVPFIFIEYFQSNEDYYVSFWFATIGRIIRLLSAFISISLPALYVSFTNYHQEEIPLKLFVAIASSRDGVPLSNISEVILMLIGFEILREAGDRIPSSFGVSLSVVGSLIIGQVAVTAKLVSAPVVFIVAIAATTGLLNTKMKSAVIIIRILLLAASAFFGIYGYALGVFLVLSYLFSMKSFGAEYMAYLLPFGGKSSPDVPLRAPLDKMKYRPDFARSKVKIGEKNA